MPYIRRFDFPPSCKREPCPTRNVSVMPISNIYLPFSHILFIRSHWHSAIYLYQFRAALNIHRFKIYKKAKEPLNVKSFPTARKATLSIYSEYTINRKTNRISVLPRYNYNGKYIYGLETILTLDICKVDDTS